MGERPLSVNVLAMLGKFWPDRRGYLWRYLVISASQSFRSSMT
jgi:hypothetical protein